MKKYRSAGGNFFYKQMLVVSMHLKGIKTCSCGLWKLEKHRLAKSKTGYPCLLTFERMSRCLFSESNIVDVPLTNSFPVSPPVLDTHTFSN